MKQGSAFWDSSALVPLCVREPASQMAQSQVRKYAPVVWWGSLVEVHSAVARLHRARSLNDAHRDGALSRLRILSAGWKEILPDDTLRELAGGLLDKHPLRSADSMQLAAALTWCQARPAKRIFVCRDDRLSDAAEAVGFSVQRLK
ncbi:MAG TPA: type II toxin-antitoxin system VapC family toxin [Candidatus Dormibacteraeota bacterium]|nr:type II toxin-antitoxin system VapC family toxin [Candidatus Dormibacteraeota bacterium]